MRKFRRCIPQKLLDGVKEHQKFEETHFRRFKNLSTTLTVWFLWINFLEIQFDCIDRLLKVVDFRVTLSVEWIGKGQIAI